MGWQRWSCYCSDGFCLSCPSVCSCNWLPLSSSWWWTCVDCASLCRFSDSVVFVWIVLMCWRRPLDSNHRATQGRRRECFWAKKILTKRQKEDSKKMGKKNARHEMRMVEFAFAPTPAPAPVPAPAARARATRNRHQQQQQEPYRIVLSPTCQSSQQCVIQQSPSGQQQHTALYPSTYRL